MPQGVLSGKVCLWSVADGQALKTMKGDNTDNVQCVTVTADGKAALAGGNKDKKIRVFSLADGSQLPSLQGHLKTATCLAVSADGRMLASGSDDNTVILWTDKDAAK